MIEIEDTNWQRKAQLGRCRIAFESRHSLRTFAIVRAKSWPRTADSPVAFGEVPAFIRFTDRTDGGRIISSCRKNARTA